MCINIHMDELTLRQQQVLAFIRSHLACTGRPPTRVEIAAALGFKSANAAQQHLRALAAKGAIALHPGHARGISLPEAAPGEAAPEPGIPLIGRVAAGAPVLAQANIEGRYALGETLFRPMPDYLLRVHGMSMCEAAIIDGDLVAVHATPTAANGEIVVARLDDEVTVKRFRRDGPRVWLLPANPDFTPIELDLREQSLAIEGRVVGVIRSLG